MNKYLYVITEKEDKEFLPLASIDNLRDLTNSSYNSGENKRSKNAITQAFSRAVKNEEGYKVIDFGANYQVEKMPIS